LLRSFYQQDVSLESYSIRSQD